MKDLDPYADIEKVPLFAEDQMQSRGYSVRLEDPAAPTGWREVGLVSEEYLLVSNTRVREMALEIAERSPLRWKETKRFFDGKRFLLGLQARPEESPLVEVDVGDTVGLGLLLENSYDGSRKLSASAYAHRLVCSNGMLMPEHFASIRFRHDNTGRGWEEELERALHLLEGAEADLRRFGEAAKRLASWRLGSSELETLRREVLEELPLTLWAKSLDRYLLKEEHTGWGLLNAATRVLWHRDRSLTDFSHNAYVTTGLVRYGAERLGQEENGREYPSWVYEREV